MDPKKSPMPVQDPEVRRNNFDEVALGYTYETAVIEAQRCLNCKNQPCVSGCPVNIHIPEFIAKVKEGKYEDAKNFLKLGISPQQVAAGTGLSIAEVEALLEDK